VSTDNESTQGALDNDSNGIDQENIGQQQKPKDDAATVKLESYNKIKKSWQKEKALNEDIAAKLELREKADLEQQGKFKELLDIEQKRSLDFEAKYKESISRTAKFSVTSKIKEIAAREGCINTEDLVSLSDLNAFDYDDDYQVDEQQVKNLVEDFKKTRPYFFQGKKPNIQDGVLKPSEGSSSYEDEIMKAQTQQEFDAIRKKYNKD